MTVLITGVSCVGKTTVGQVLAEDLGIPFEDLDQAVERHLGAPISRLQQRYGTMDLYREAAAGVLASLLRSFGGRRAVIALPPSGLMGPFWRQIKGRRVVTIVLDDTAGNILGRIRFYDDDSRPIEKSLTARERTLYRRVIREDLTYFNRSYRKADARVAISGCSVVEAANRVRDALRRIEEGTEPKHGPGVSGPGVTDQGSADQGSDCNIQVWRTLGV